MAGRGNRNNFTEQVADELSLAIRTQKYPPGFQLPSVEKLADEMGVGRSTLREALRLLQAKGLVEVIHGLGTFVSKERITRSTGSVYSFSEAIRERGMKPRSEVLEQKVTIADEEIAFKLQITVGDKVNLLRRLRFADDLPMAMETTISAHARFPDLLKHDWSGETSLYALLQEKYRVAPQNAVQIVQAVTARRSESQLLLIAPKSPILLVETIAYDQQGIPIEFGRSYYRADRYQYKVWLRRE
jgi:GntR family transcriptional regulator